MGRDSASPRWPERWVSTATRSAVGRGSSNNPECAGAAKPSAPAGHPSSARSSCAPSRAVKREFEAFQFASGLWTASRVRDLIKYRTGVRYHEDQSGAFCASPTGPASGRAGGRWSATRRRSGSGRKSRARGSKEALCERRTIVFIDENGLSERPHRVRTVSIIGETMASWEPELRCTAGLNPTQLCRMQPKGASSGAGLPHLDGADRVEQHQDVERDVVADPEGQQQFEQYQEQD